MKTYKELISSLVEAWPGTPEYKKRFGDRDTTGAGSRHNIDSSKSGVVKATRRYNPDSGESEEATKDRADAAAAPAKRGRGRPPGKYGTYKKKVQESLEILESMDSEEEINDFIESLDEESTKELLAFFEQAKRSEGVKVHEGEHEEEDDEEDEEDEEDEMKESLIGKQKKLDANKNDKLDSEDFKKLRGEAVDIEEAYKGKHPKNIKAVAYSSADKTVNVTLNDGSKHSLTPKHTGGKMPKMGEHISQYVKEEVEQVEEALKGDMHQDAHKVLKHIKPEHHSVYKPFLKKGVYKGNYKDRADVMSAAEKAGHAVKEEVDAIASIADFITKQSKGEV